MTDLFRAGFVTLGFVMLAGGVGWYLVIMIERYRRAK